MCVCVGVLCVGCGDRVCVGESLSTKGRVVVGEGFPIGVVRAGVLLVDARQIGEAESEFCCRQISKLVWLIATVPALFVAVPESV